MTKWLLIFLHSMSQHSYSGIGPGLYDTHAECKKEQRERIAQYKSEHPKDIYYTICVHVVLDYEWEE